MNSIFYFDLLDQIYPDTCKVVCGLLVIKNSDITLTYKGTKNYLTKADTGLVAHVWIVSKNKVIECSSEFLDLPSENKEYLSYKEYTKIYGRNKLSKDLLTNICLLNVQVAKCIRLPNAQNEYYKDLRRFVSEDYRQIS